MKLFFQTYWPILVLLCVEIGIAAANYRPGTYLMGWDNVMPEFNFRQAFITNIFGVWQEHRGVGLPDGMGHAANLIHTLFTWILSFVVPQSAIRYIVQFFLHFIGMVGMYILLSVIPGSTRDPSSSQKLDSGSGAGMTRTLGALFYGLNLVTIQMFYTPLEAFSFHFAALPWLAYSLLQYLRQPSRNTLLLFTTISILTIPQFFIPTLLLPTGILLGVIGVFGVIRDNNYIKPALTAGAAFLCVNAFWLLPYLYNIPTNAPVIRNAKINKMSSEEVYERNRAFGDIGNVLSMKGFMLDFEDVNAEGQPLFVMDTWRNWIQQPFVSPILFFFAFLMVFGILTIVVNKTAIAEKLTTFPFVIMWIIAFLFLANNTPGISDTMNTLRDRFPLFAEAYRFPFTKFSLLFGFSGSILAMWGLKNIVETLRIKSRLSLDIGAGLIVGGAIVTLTLPAFRGQFFYDALRVNLPKDYLTLFAFMDKEGHEGRIAYLPQPSYWSWKHYKFGYVGSGFLWYGLPQPLMDRAFDPWSQYNEQYYWELVPALYGKNAEKLEQVFEKYDIRYIILDENIRAPGHERSLFTEETKELLALLPDMKGIASLGKLTVFERITSADSFIHAVSRLSDSVKKPQFRETNSEPVFSTKHSEVLNPQAVKPCGVLKSGTATGKYIDGMLRIRSRNQRACLSFGDNSLSHTSAYRVEVITNNISGRPLLFAIINNTAKHVEVEEYLTGNDTFYLPPLAPDGLGYTVYFSNDSIFEESVNDIVRVEFYEIDYKKPPPAVSALSVPVTVSHPNPAWYRVTVPKNAKALLLSQAYNPNWLAFSNGKLLNKHTKVNGWAQWMEIVRWRTRGRHRILAPATGVYRIWSDRSNDCHYLST